MLFVFWKELMMMNSSVTYCNWFRLFGLSALINLAFLSFLYSGVGTLRASIFCVCVCTCTHAFIFTSFRLHFIYCSINLIVSELLQHHTILSWLAFSGGMFLWSFMILYMPNVFILHMRYWKKVWWRFDFLIIYYLNSCILWYTLMPKTFTGCVSFYPNFKDKFQLFRKLWHLIFFLFFYLLFKNYWDPWTILKEMGVCLLMFFFCCISVPQLRLASRLIWMAESYK